MKLFFTFFFILTLISAIAADPFKMPENTQELARNESGKAWRMNGVLPLALEQGCFDEKCCQCGVQTQT